MLFEVCHRTEYLYSQPVLLEPHTFFLKPRESGGQRLIEFDCTIDPAPQTRAFVLDAFGNEALRAWFLGATDILRITTRSRVETARSNPFDYLVDPAASCLPIQYSAANRSVLAPYLRGDAVAGVSSVAPTVVDFSGQAAARTGFRVSEFLPELCRTIHALCVRIHRPRGGPWTAAETLSERRGACRDLTVLFMECCRAQGLAARFVSGYFEGDPFNPQKELHAWAEVFVEGGGWRGFDPTCGLAATDSHMAVASANSPAQAMPVAGAFRGDAIATLQTQVEITRLAASAPFDRVH